MTNLPSSTQIIPFSRSPQGDMFFGARPQFLQFPPELCRGRTLNLCRGRTLKQWGIILTIQ